MDHKTLWKEVTEVWKSPEKAKENRIKKDTARSV